MSTQLCSTAEQITGDTATSPISTDELHSGLINRCAVGDNSAVDAHESQGAGSEVGEATETTTAPATGTQNKRR